MKPFQQPILEEKEEQLRCRLPYVQNALYHWQKRINEGEYARKNVDFFQTQKDNILKKLKRFNDE